MTRIKLKNLRMPVSSSKVSERVDLVDGSLNGIARQLNVELLAVCWKWHEDRVQIFIPSIAFQVPNPILTNLMTKSWS